MNPNKILQIFGFKKALEVYNMRELRTIFSKSNQRSWHRLIAKTNKIKLTQNKDSFCIMRKCLMKFKPLQIAQK